LPGVADEPEGSEQPHEVREKVEAGMAEAIRTPVTDHLDRLLDELRLAVLGIVLGLGLTILFGVQQEEGWLCGAVAGVGSIAALVILFRWRLSRNAIARILDWVVGRR
jgi:hypothetical protein